MAVDVLRNIHIRGKRMLRSFNIDSRSSGLDSPKAGEFEFCFGRIVRNFVIGLVTILSFGEVLAQLPTEVALAGLAYAGSEGAVSTRFPYSQQYVKDLGEAGLPVQQRLRQALSTEAPQHLLIVDQIQELQGRDQALAVAMVLSSETVKVEQFGSLYKLMVLLRAQTMFFDFKSMNVVRSYPLSFAYVDLLDHDPSEAEKRERVKLVFEGANDKPGLIARFVSSVAKASIPSHVPRYLQVTSAQIAPEVLESFPDFIKADPQTWLADMAGEAISTRVEVPIVPFAKGYAIGNVMSMRVSDGRVWELRLPKPDYVVKVDLTGVKKIKFSEVEGGATTYVYGAYAQTQIEQPDLNKLYLNTKLKNGESRVIPASQKYVDDFPHFYDAINGLLTKLAVALSGTGDDSWIKSAAAAKDIGQQLNQTMELMKQCK